MLDVELRPKASALIFWPQLKHRPRLRVLARKAGGHLARCDGHSEIQHSCRNQAVRLRCSGEAARQPPGRGASSSSSSSDCKPRGRSEPGGEAMLQVGFLKPNAAPPQPGRPSPVSHQLCRDTQRISMRQQAGPRQPSASGHYTPTMALMLQAGSCNSVLQAALATCGCHAMSEQDIVKMAAWLWPGPILESTGHRLHTE